MSRRNLLVVVVAVAVSALGLAALIYTASAAARPAAPALTTTITVTIGKPSEFKYTLSKKIVPLGTVVFKVVNKGKIAHDFKIAGKKTPLLAPGKSATLRVTFKKKGSYAYLCTVTGHAAAGMKGVLGVGVTKITTPPPPPPPPGGGTGAACTSPVNTTVQVEEWDYGFTLSQDSIACGRVTFVMRNTGAVVHNFSVNNVADARGKLLNPAETATMTVNFTNKGKYEFVCDVPHHIELGMLGTITIT